MFHVEHFLIIKYYLFFILNYRKVCYLKKCVVKIFHVEPDLFNHDEPFGTTVLSKKNLLGVYAKSACTSGISRNRKMVNESFGVSKKPDKIIQILKHASGILYYESGLKATLGRDYQKIRPLYVKLRVKSYVSLFSV